MTTLSYTEKLSVLDCASCGMKFAISADFEERRRNDHKTFYCPAGHHNWYGQKSEAEKLREQLEEEQRRVIRLTNQRDAQAAARDHAEAQARGYKGALTKAKKRAAKGVCPAPGCKRSFVDVARHVATQHPELVDDQADAGVHAHPGA